MLSDVFMGRASPRNSGQIRPWSTTWLPPKPRNLGDKTLCAQKARGPMGKHICIYTHCPGRKRKMLLLSEAPLGKGFLVDFCKGDMPATSVQKNAKLSVRQEGEQASETMKHLAGIGNGQPSHCERDLKKLKISPRDAIEVPEPYEMLITQKKETRRCAGDEALYNPAARLVGKTLSEPGGLRQDLSRR